MHFYNTHKNKYKICSFCGETGFNKPALWGYYANGLKGVAIEVEINIIENKNKEQGGIYKVNYIKSITDYKKPMEIKDFLINKFDIWENEDEYRFLINKMGNDRYYPIGKITAIYFGNPHYGIKNKEAIERKSHKLTSYNEKKEYLKDIANKMGVRCFNVNLGDNGAIEVQNC